MQVRQMSIDHLSKLSVPDIEKIKLGREYEVLHWFSEGIEAVAYAKTVELYPVEDMAKELGWETTAKILWIRGRMDRAIEDDPFVIDLQEVTCYGGGCSERLRLPTNLSCYRGHSVRSGDGFDADGFPCFHVRGRVKGGALSNEVPRLHGCKEQIEKMFAVQLPGTEGAKSCKQDLSSTDTQFTSL